MSAFRVLIVDDDPALLIALPETLEIKMPTLAVDTADSAPGALARVAETDYDAIVSDIKMPGMDGLALLREIRVLRPTTPTLLITGHGDHDLAIQALRGGAYDFIQKPIDRDYFVAALTRAIQVRQLRRRLEEQQSALERHAVDLERVVEERTRDLREANRVKDEFLATLSHELRTPLNSMFGWIYLLREGALDEATAQRAIHTIERNTKSLAEIINDLLEVSRIITGKLKLDVRPVELGSVIEAALEVVRPAIDAKDIDLHVSLEPAVDPVLGDSSRLQQIVWNLLSNAIKFTPIRGRVEVRLEKIGSNASITVSDNGAGIAEAFLPYVFDRFRQADSTFTRKHGGLGLGLAIVRHLVEIHGGSVAANSPGEGKGATFVVTFPLVETEATCGTRPGTPGPLGNGATLDGLRVLIVDDEPDARELLSAMLEQWGAKVTAVATAAEAINCLGVDHALPDVLVSDLGMPIEDGFELISKVRAREPERGGRIPAIALTAYARSEDRARALAAGYEIHLPKPVEPAQLSDALGALVQRKRDSRLAIEGRYQDSVSFS
ncbi:MAG TPA: response regulator [Blastocatellia bacterium]|nr:response regulator [Blastocatellia bacterium]